jgi:hypothetical protein
VIGPETAAQAATAAKAAKAPKAKAAKEASDDEDEEDLPVVYWCVPHVTLKKDERLLGRVEDIYRLMKAGAYAAILEAMSGKIIGT